MPACRRRRRSGSSWRARSTPGTGFIPRSTDLHSHNSFGSRDSRTYLQASSTESEMVKSAIVGLSLLRAVFLVDVDPTDDAATTGDTAGRAIELYERAVTPDRGAGVLLDRGIDDDRRGRYDRALQDYGRVIELDPRNDRAFGNRC